MVDHTRTTSTKTSMPSNSHLTPPVKRLGIISDPGVAVSSSLPTPTLSVPMPLVEQFETISAMDEAQLGGQAAPSMTSMSPAPSGSAQATITSYAPPIFPITATQTPIYTICPDTTGYLNATSNSALNATALYRNATATGIGNATDYVSPPLSPISVPVNATALLPNGSHTTFLSQPLSTPSPSPTPALTARLVLGQNGCQTLHSASTIHFYSTAITRVGQGPISVTDCAQFVTFSSSSVAVAAIPTEVGNCPNIPASPPTDLPTAPIGTNPASQTQSPTVSVRGKLSDATITSNANAGLGFGIAFFAAPWHEIAAGVVPGLVQVANCADEKGEDCTTSNTQRAKPSKSATASNVSLAEDDEDGSEELMERLRSAAGWRTKEDEVRGSSTVEVMEKT